MRVSDYLAHEVDLADYIQELVAWCKNELRKAEQHGQVMQLADKALDQLSIPWGKLDVLTKYQTALDNQTYKAMKALRDAQEWRLKTIEAVALESVSEAA